MSGYTTLDHPALVRALAHPLRARILSVLQERRGSPRELADELEAPLGNVSYHVRILADLKLIKLVKKTPRRGAIEHHYEATSAARVTDQVWGQTSGVVKQAMAAAALDEVGRTVTEAAATGGFDREDAHLTRTPLVLDERGWQELGKALASLLERAEGIEERSRKRLARADHEGERSTGLVMMLFERLTVVEQRPPTPSDGAKRRRTSADTRRVARAGARET